MGKLDQSMGAGAKRSGRVVGAIGLIAFALAACESSGPRAVDDGKNKAAPVAAAPTPPPSAAAPAPAPLLEHCDRPLGSISVEEDAKAPWTASLRSAKLGAAEPMLSMLVQLSNCFILVDGPVGSKARPSADFSLSPSIKSPPGAKGEGGRASLSLVDNRSATPVATADGVPSAVDADRLASLLSGSIGATAGGYTASPAGRTWAAAFADSYNQIVRSAAAYTPRPSAAVKPAEPAAAKPAKARPPRKAAPAAKPASGAP